MNNLEEKEKKLNGLIDRLSNLSHSYSQSSYDAENIKTKRNQLEKLVSRTANNVFLPLTVGGGISSIDSIQNMLVSGADRIFARENTITGSVGVLLQWARIDQGLEKLGIEMKKGGMHRERENGW